jgi:TolA-binding protein
MARARATGCRQRGLVLTAPISDVAHHALELLKRVHADLTDVKREQSSMGLRLASMEQHLAANQLEIARLSGDMQQVKSDISLIKRRPDLVDA